MLRGLDGERSKEKRPTSPSSSVESRKKESPFTPPKPFFKDEAQSEMFPRSRSRLRAQPTSRNDDLSQQRFSAEAVDRDHFLLQGSAVQRVRHDAQVILHIRLTFAQTENFTLQRNNVDSVSESRRKPQHGLLQEQR